MKLWAFLIVIFSVVSAMAQEEPRSVRGLLALGSEHRPLRNVEGHFEDRVLTNYALGAGHGNFIYLFERSLFKEKSGNSSLSVHSEFESLMAWMSWRARKFGSFSPFVSGGAGAFRTTAETSLLGSVSKNESLWKFTSGASLGLSLDVPILWVSIEARLLFADEPVSRLTLGGLARVGIWF